MSIENFITKDILKTMAGCVCVVEACTEALKILLDGVGFHSQVFLWVSLAFSVLISGLRYVLDEEKSKEKLILAVINIVPIFLGAVGTYQVGIKPLEKLILGS